MQKIALSIIIATSSWHLSACQSPSETPDITATPASEHSMSVERPVKVAADISQPTAIADAAIMAKDCTALNQAMQKVGDDGKIEAIYNIQDHLKACLPMANNAEVMALLKSYQAMYSQFLATDLESESDYETFNNAIYELYYGDGLSSAQLKTLTPRDQYLVSLVKSDADVSIYDEGEGYFSFTHNLKAMADIFTPYLHEDQSKFIQRMAVDNQDIFWSDASVTVSFAELVERALFWEDYIQRYPDGYAVKDAKYLLDFYRYIIFFGTDNTQWTDDAIHEFLMPEDEQMIQRLSKRPNSILAKDSQNFLKFLALPDSERQRKYPAPSTNDEGYEYSDWAIVRYQLDKALQITSIWDDIEDKDCFNGLFCTDDNKLW